MLRKSITLVVLGTLTAGGLLAAGCTSNDAKPYALTGRSDSVVSAAERQEQLRYTDSKGRYREDLRMMGLAQRP